MEHILFILGAWLICFVIINIYDAGYWLKMAEKDGMRDTILLVMFISTLISLVPIGIYFIYLSFK